MKSKLPSLTPTQSKKITWCSGTTFHSSRHALKKNASAQMFTNRLEQKLTLSLSRDVGQ
jgi:hypothetical protein